MTINSTAGAGSDAASGNFKVIRIREAPGPESLYRDRKTARPPRLEE
jgi:hypothetical protein